MNRNSFFTASLALLAVCMFISGFTISASAQQNEYYNSEHGYSLRYPESWTLSEEPDGIVMISAPFIFPDQYPENLWIMVESVGEGMSLEEYTALRKGLIASEEGLTDPYTIIAETDFQISGGPGYSVILTTRVPEGIDISVLQAWTIANKNAYVITFASDGNIEAEDTAIGIIDSFMIEDESPPNVVPPPTTVEQEVAVVIAIVGGISIVAVIVLLLFRARGKSLPLPSQPSDSPHSADHEKIA